LTPTASLAFVIPAYNAAATLPATLASVASQTRSDWQAVIVDDGSNDTTNDIASAAAASDPRISSYVIAHSGVSEARNFGLGKIDAEWVCFLDADDQVAADFNRIMLNAAGPHVDLVYCGYQRVTPAGDVIDIFSENFLRQGFECAARECPTAIHSVIARRNFVEILGGFDPSLATCEDWDLWQRLTRAGARIAAVTEFLAMYQMSDGGLSRQYRQLIPDAHKVIKRGFSTDARVKRPARTAANGAHGEDASTRCSFFTAWCAAAEVGAGSDGAALLATYPSDCGGHTAALGQSLALALAIGAKKTMADMASVLPRLKYHYDRFLETFGSGQRQAGAARGIAYAIEREILHRYPSGKSAQLNQVAKIAIDLRAISGVIAPAPGVDILILEFLLRHDSHGQMEVAILAPYSRADVARLALEFFGWRKFVTLCGLLWRPDYSAVGAFYGARAVCMAGIKRLHGGASEPTGLRNLLRGALKQSAIYITSGGKTSVHRQLESGFPDPKTFSGARVPIMQTAAPQPPALQKEEEQRAAYWNKFFSQPDPWNYSCDYEQTKYQRTLDILPPGSLESVLEIACAEGIFTRQLAKRAKTLIAADISEVALKRAREQCGDCTNTEFRLIDVLTDDIPSGKSLIICSEFFYYVGGRERLPEIVCKIRDALVPGGYLVTANAFVLKDDMSSTGFDWDQEYGAKVIHEALSETPGLALEQSIITDLYRIDCFKRCDPDRAPQPLVRHLGLDCQLSPSLSRQIVWGGAWGRRSDLIKHEQCWRIPILAYHRIATDGIQSLRRWRVDPDIFRKQLQLLRVHGYYRVTSDDVLKARQTRTALRGRPVLITFDDGYQDFADTAWPILEAEGFNAEVFIVTDRVGTSASWDAGGGKAAPLMDWRAIENLHEKGVKFGSHLATHTPATNLTSHALLCELIRSRADLESRLHVPVLSVAAPYGATDERYNRLLASVGYQIEFSGEGGKTDIRQQCYGMRRLQIEGSWSMSDFAQALEIAPASPSEHRDQRLVSVVVPAYNAARTIDETLRSARYQTHRNLEILVVDDGSRDATAAIVSKHAAIDARVRLITQINAGVAAARNRGIAEAKSDLIAPLDADDLWAPTKIEKQLLAMHKEGEGTALVYTWFAVIDEYGNVRDLEHRPLDSGHVLRRMCRGNLVGNGSSPLMRKSAIQEAGGFEPGLRSAHAQGCEDLLLYFRIAERHEFAVVPEHLTGYRRHSATMSEDSLQMLRSYHLVTREMHRKHPEYAEEIRLGEADLADWLIRKALRNLRLDTAIAIFAHIARTDLRYIVAKFIPGLFLRAGRILFGTPRIGAGSQMPPTFQIGSPGNVEVGS
jgi:glycosyltransferase involved in cell wall biosynthesis/peptidoglycan/xylan/chitin deacetylase (PgdA/CDA1 family)/SAM-dependent methyltransferase